MLVAFLFLFNKGTEQGPHHITEPRTVSATRNIPRSSPTESLSLSVELIQSDMIKCLRACLGSFALI